MNPRIKTVKALPAYSLELKFSNGEIKEFNMQEYLQIGVFKELQDVNYFNQVRVVGGTIEWPNGQDLCPDTLYEQSTMCV